MRLKVLKLMMRLLTGDSVHGRMPEVRFMIPQKLNVKHIFGFFPLCVWLITSLACARSSQDIQDPWRASKPGLPQTAIARAITQTPQNIDQQSFNKPILTPTPDQPRVLPTLRVNPEQYVVQSGDTLATISRKYSVGLQTVIDANQLSNPDLLEVGQELTIPAPVPGKPGTGFKVIPDSELVYSPSSVGFDIDEFVTSHGGYLAGYEEEVDGRMLSGAQIVERVSRDFSVNPRILLALLEYRSGWVTEKNPAEKTLTYPLLDAETWRKGLYYQLTWGANNLNRGYYLWRVNAIGAWSLTDGSVVPIDPTINAGTAGVQYTVSLLFDRANWDAAVSQTGLYQTYERLFGFPFNFASDPVVPGGLVQPEMQLPIEPDRAWAFTGGPHGGWGEGSAWAALDFAPPGEALGCVQSDEWVVAVANGTILRADLGAVIQDLDTEGEKTNDGLEQTGWVVLYMHIEGRDRVQAGDYVRAGEKIGHPSCEGGVSTGTHVHLARRYNGEWIAADQTLPFVLDGWISRGAGKEYDGTLQKEDQVVEAWEGYFTYNTIQR
jgi:LasA protease